MKSPDPGMYLLQFWLACSYLVPFFIAQDVLPHRHQINCKGVLEEIPQYQNNRDDMDNRWVMYEEEDRDTYPDQYQDTYEEEYENHEEKTTTTRYIKTVICSHINHTSVNIASNCGDCSKLVYMNSDLPVIPTIKNQEAQQLEGLKLAKLKIQKIEPGGFAHLPKLLVLQLENNNLTMIGKDVFNSLENLQFLNLSHNSLAEIEEHSFHGSSNIEILDLSYNKIRAIPPNIFHHLRLKTLNISNNLLVTIDDHFFPLFTELKTLILDNNRLEKFPSCFGSSISHLSIRFNFITSFNFTDLPTSLDVFLIGNNRINHLNQYSLQLVLSLRTLDISNNFLGEFNPELLKYLEHLEVLDVSGNNMRTINTKLFSYSKSLQRVNLGKNNITALPKGVFQHLYDLINLDVSENNITSLQQGVLKDLVSLQMLNLSHNEIGYLQAGVFNGMKKLGVLDLKSNHLDSLRFHVFSPLENLRVLDISYNRLTTMRLKGSFLLKRGASIALDGNNFTCSNLAETISDLKSERMNIIEGKSLSSENIDGISCSDSNRKTNPEDDTVEIKYFFERGYKNTSFYDFFRDFREPDGTESNVNKLSEYLRNNLTVDFSKNMKNHVKDFINFENASFRDVFQRMEDITRHNEGTSLDGLSSTLQNEIESFVTFENSSFRNLLDKMSEMVDRKAKDRKRSENISELMKVLQEIHTEKLVSSRETENITELIEAINQLKLFLILSSCVVMLLVLGIRLFPIARKSYFTRELYESNHEIPMLS